jgi:hypothetical protein
MAEDDHAHLRSWQEIAEEASKEIDPEKLLKLTHELEDALDKRDKELSKRKSAASVEHLPSSRAKGF